MNTDPHKKLASELFGVPYDDVTSEQRAYAKLQNYILGYTSPIERTGLRKLHPTLRTSGSGV